MKEKISDITRIATSNSGGLEKVTIRSWGEIINDVIDKGLQYKPQQHRVELFNFLEFLVKRGNLKNALEIGTGTAGLTFVLSEIFDHVVGVDRTNRMEYTKDNIDFVVMDTQSHNPEAYNKIKELGTYDLIFIDGLHTAEGVENDYKLFKSLLKPNGILAFHDIKPSEGNDIVKGKPVHRTYNCTVSDFIAKTDFSEYKNHIEFIDYNDTWMAQRVCDMTNFCGIGVYFND